MVTNIPVSFFRVVGLGLQVFLLVAVGRRENEGLWGLESEAVRRASIECSAKLSALGTGIKLPGALGFFGLRWVFGVWTPIATPLRLREAAATATRGKSHARHLPRRCR